MTFDSISIITFTMLKSYIFVFVRCIQLVINNAEQLNSDYSIIILTYNTIKYNGDKHQEKEH